MEEGRERVVGTDETLDEAVEGVQGRVGFEVGDGLGDVEVREAGEEVLFGVGGFEEQESAKAFAEQVQEADNCGDFLVSPDVHELYLPGLIIGIIIFIFSYPPHPSPSCNNYFQSLPK